MIWPVDNNGIVEQILAREGGFTNNPLDSGGPTNFGITQADYAAFKGRPVTLDEMENMPRSDAVTIYNKRYISGPKFDGLNNVHVRSIVVDTGVLFGPARAVIFLQRAAGIYVSGSMDPPTLTAVNNASDPRGLCNTIAVERVRYHIERCLTDHSQLTFLRGWSTRAFAFIE